MRASRQRTLALLKLGVDIPIMLRMVGVSQRALAVRAGLSQPRVCRILSSAQQARRQGARAVLATYDAVETATGVSRAALLRHAGLTDYINAYLAGRNAAAVVVEGSGDVQGNPKQGE